MVAGRLYLAASRKGWQYHVVAASGRESSVLSLYILAPCKNPSSHFSLLLARSVTRPQRSRRLQSLSRWNTAKLTPLLPMAYLAWRTAMKSCVRGAESGPAHLKFLHAISIFSTPPKGEGYIVAGGWWWTPRRSLRARALRKKSGGVSRLLAESDVLVVPTTMRYWSTAIVGDFLRFLLRSRYNRMRCDHLAREGEVPCGPLGRWPKSKQSRREIGFRARWCGSRGLTG